MNDNLLKRECMRIYEAVRKGDVFLAASIACRVCDLFDSVECRSRLKEIKERASDIEVLSYFDPPEDIIKSASDELLKSVTRARKSAS